MLNYVLLDTDVFSFLFKHSPWGERYLPHLTGKTLCLSFQTVAELYYWAEKQRWGTARHERLHAWMRAYVVIPYDDAIALAWARIKTQREAQGRPISAQDAWIAACAVRYDCPLVTHNAKDYAGILKLRLITEPAN